MDSFGSSLPATGGGVLLGEGRWHRFPAIWTEPRDSVQQEVHKEASGGLYFPIWFKYSPNLNSHYAGG
jgi:hypothetical protein